MIVNIIENLMITVIIVDMDVKGIVKVMKEGMGFMIEKRFELRLCSNGSYYVYENGTLTDK